MKNVRLRLRAATIQGNAFWIFPLKSTLIVFSFVVLHRGWNTRPGLFYIQLLYSANSNRLFGGTVTVGRYSNWNILHEFAEFLFYWFCNMALTSKKKEKYCIGLPPLKYNIISFSVVSAFVWDQPMATWQRSSTSVLYNQFWCATKASGKSLKLKANSASKLSAVALIVSNSLCSK